MNPKTRKEAFLAKAGGQPVSTPKPITREEMFLQRIAENGGAGTGGGGGDQIIIRTDDPAANHKTVVYDNNGTNELHTLYYGDSVVFNQVKQALNLAGKVPPVYIFDTSAGYLNAFVPAVRIESNTYMPQRYICTGYGDPFSSYHVTYQLHIYETAEEAAKAAAEGAT